MNSSIYGPYAKDGTSLYVYMSAFGLWAWHAERYERHAHGTVEATNRVEAWEKAYEAARRELWTAEQILEREA